MSKTQTALIIARMLERLPVPFVPQVAQGVDALLTVIEAEHGITLTTLRDEIAAAREPWQRIHDVATAQQLGVHAGSTGE